MEDATTGREGTERAAVSWSRRWSTSRATSRGWRRISLNDIGNAILINGEDMLAGLKRRKALRLRPRRYVFSARDEATKEV